MRQSRPCGAQASGAGGADAAASLRSGFGLPARGIDRLDVGEEPVTATRDGLDEARILGRVAERLTDLVDRLVEAVVEIDDCPGPDSAPQFLPAHQFP